MNEYKKVSSYEEYINLNDPGFFTYTTYSSIIYKYNFQYHRIDGPAVEYISDGEKRYYLNRNLLWK